MAQWESRRVHFLRRTRRYICVRFRRQLSEDIYCYEILKNNNGTYMYTNMYSKRLIDLIHVLFASSRQHVYTMINDCTMLYKLEIIRIHKKTVIFLFFSTKKSPRTFIRGEKNTIFSRRLSVATRQKKKKKRKKSSCFPAVVLIGRRVCACVHTHISVNRLPTCLQH